MNRRRFLGLAGMSATAGCTTQLVSETTPSESETTTTSTSMEKDNNPTSGGSRVNVSITSITVPPDLPIKPNVVAINPLATEDHPPQLRTTLTNTMEDPVIVGDIRNAHFEDTFSESGKYVLVPENSGYGNAEPGCWRITGGVGQAATYQKSEIPSNSRSTRLLNLFAHGESESCLPTGTYQFKTLIDTSTSTAQSTQNTSWAFTIQIEHI